MTKENDIILNMLENPEFSISDFQQVGLDANNTALQSEDTYLNSPVIMENSTFKDLQGNFDKNKFHNTYQQAAASYNYMATDKDPNKDEFKATFSKYNIWAPEDQVDYNPGFKIVRQANPFQITKSETRIGQSGPQTLTVQEIAQSQPVVDSKTGKKLAAPNDETLFSHPLDWIKSTFFDDVKVLAQYDQDVDINGKTSNQTGFDKNHINHTKGDIKLNEDGSPYYETLGGRNIYGRQVLHASDVLTVDGSAANSLDFMDSDSMDKSAIGSLVKNTALVGAMFLPVVGPYITGATILQQAIGLGTTLGKIALGSDSPTLNRIEGLVEATNPQNTRSQYSQQNAWSMENLLGLAGQTLGQLKQQRMIFEKSPIFAGKDAKLSSAKGQEAWKDEYTNKLAKDYANSPIRITDPKQFTQQLLVKNQENAMKAATALESKLKDYYKAGAVLSKAYMTMLTVNDIYGQAKLAGASDTDSALLTTGYAAAEYALLSTGIGSWILPELRMNRMQNKAVQKALTKDILGTWSKMSGEAVNKAAKHQYAQKILNFGKKLAKADWDVGKKGWNKAAIQSTLTAGLAEGTEEVSEEVLSDFSKAIFNTIEDLSGKKQGHFDNILENGWQTRYAMNFLGGALGGGIANAKMDFSMAKDYSDMTFDKAVQTLVSMDRNDNLKSFRKDMNKTTIGNKNLSATKKLLDDNGNVIGWEQGTDTDNQDLEIKNLLNKQLDLIHNTLKSHGADLADDQLIDASLIPDLKYSFLKNTTTAGRLIQDYNTLGVQALQLTQEIKDLKTQQLGVSGDQAIDKENNPEYDNFERQIKEKQDQLKDIDQKFQDIRDGKDSPLAMRDALLEATPFILNNFMTADLKTFAENELHKDYDSITKSEFDDILPKYQNYLKTSKKDDVHEAGDRYSNIMSMFKGNFENMAKVAQAMSDDKDIKGQMKGLQTTLETLSPYWLDQGAEGWGTTEWLQMVQKLASRDKGILTDQTSETSPLVSDLLSTIREFDTNIAELAPESEDLKDLYTEFQTKVGNIINTNLLQNISKLTDKFIKVGYINAAIKDDVINTLQQSKDAIIKLQTKSLDKEGTSFINPGENINDIYSIGTDEYENPLDNIVEDLSKKIETVKALPYTPIQELLDSFGLSITGKPLTISSLLSYMSEIYNNSREDLTQFTIGSKDSLNALKQAGLIVDMFTAALEGARTDTGGIRSDTVETLAGSAIRGEKNNVFGINATLNELAKKMKTENWKELPEISGEIADMMLTDAYSIKRKIEFYQELYGINNGRKLSAQPRIDTNLKYILYNRLNLLVAAIPEKWDKTNLQKALDNTKTLSESASSKNLTLSQEAKIQIEKEATDIEEAIYNFFNVDNNSLFNNINDIADFLNSSNFNFYNKGEEILNENSENITEHDFVYWLATKAAMNSTAFKQRYKEHIGDTMKDGTIIAPLPGQELAIQLGVASSINGDVFDRFSKAMKKSMIDDFTKASYDERVTKLKHFGFDDNSASICATDEMSKYFQNLDLVPLYTNSIFIEGISGSGKTSVVGYMITTLLRECKPDLLKNVWVGNVTEDRAIEYRDNLKLSEDSSKTFDKKTLLSEIIDNYKSPKLNDNGDYDIANEDYSITNEGDIVSTMKLKEVQNLPSLIIIDEGSTYTHFELQKIDEFARANGISVIVTGDLDQSQAKGLLTITNKNIIDNIEKQLPNGVNLPLNSNQDKCVSLNIFLSRNNLITCPKLGSSLRVANIQKKKNLDAAQNFVRNPKGELSLLYYEDENYLKGDYVQHINKNTITELECSDNSLLMKKIDKLISLLSGKEKIGYIYYDETSPLYQKLSSTRKYADKIEFNKGNSAQGKEGNYWIIENNPKVTPKTYAQDLYTGITRAKEASIIIAPNQNLLNSQLGIEIKSNLEDFTQDISMGDPGDYCQRYKVVLNQVIGDRDLPLEVFDRTKDTTIKTVVSMSTKIPSTKTPSPPNTSNPPASPDTSALELAKIEEWRSAIFGKLSSHFGNNYKILESNKDVVKVQFDPPQSIEANFKDSFNYTTNNQDNIIKSLEISYDGKVTIITSKINGTDNQGVLKDGIDINNLLSDSNILTEEEKKKQQKLEEEQRKRSLLEYAKNELVKFKYQLPSNVHTKVTLQSNGNYKIEFLDQNNQTISLNLTNYTLEDINTLQQRITNNSLKNEQDIDNYLNTAKEIIYIEISSNTNEISCKLYLSPTTYIENTYSNQDFDQKFQELFNGQISNPLQDNIPEISENTPDKLDISSKEVNPIDPQMAQKLENMSMLFATNASFERGVAIDDTGQIKWDNNQQRNDGYRGLKKIADLNPNSMLAQYFANNDILSLDKIIAQIQYAALHQKSKGNLIEYIHKLLGLSEIYCTFAIKNTVNKTSDKITGGYSKFLKSNTEKLSYNHSDAKGDATIPLHQNFIIIIGNKNNGDLLELPLFQLNNPISIISQTDGKGNHIFQDIYNVYSQNVEYGNISSQPRALREVVKKYKDNKEYKSLINLIKLYLTSDKGDNLIWFIHDNEWVPFNDLSDYGPQQNIWQGNRSNTMQNNNRLQGTWKNLSEYINDARINVSKILVYKSDQGLSCNNGQVIPAKKGNLFVLYSDDPALTSTRQMTEQYNKQLTARADGKPIESKVKMAYVLPPTFTFEEYARKLYKFVGDTTKSIKPLGNDRTPYLILKGLFYDKDQNLNQDVKDYVIKLFGSEVYDDIITILNDLTELDQKDDNYKSFLRKLQESGKRFRGLFGNDPSSSLKSQLQNIIKQLVSPSEINDPLGKIDDSALTKLSKIFKNSGTTLYLDTKLKPTSEDIGIYKVADITDNYRTKELLADKDYKIHGNFSTSAFTSEKNAQSINNIIEQMIWQIKVKNNQTQTNDNLQYIHNNSKLGSIQQKLKEPKYITDSRNNILQYQYKSNVNCSELLNALNSNDINTVLTLINSNKYSGIGFMLPSGELVISFNPILKGDIILTNGIGIELSNFTLDKDSIEGGDGNYRFTLHTNNNEVYDVTYQPKSDSQQKLAFDKVNIQSKEISTDRLHTPEEWFNSLAEFFTNPDFKNSILTLSENIQKDSIALKTILDKGFSNESFKELKEWLLDNKNYESIQAIFGNLIEKKDIDTTIPPIIKDLLDDLDDNEKDDIMCSITINS